MCRFEDMEKTQLAYIVQLSFAAHCRTFVEELKTYNCWGCQHDRPSQKEHDCLMMVGMDPWFSYYDDALERINLRHVLQGARNVCEELGLVPLDNRWKNYPTELMKRPMIDIYLLAFKMDQVDTPQHRFEAILKAASSFYPKTEQSDHEKLNMDENINLTVENTANLYLTEWN